MLDECSHRLAGCRKFADAQVRDRCLQCCPGRLLRNHGCGVEQFPFSCRNELRERDLIHRLADASARLANLFDGRGYPNARFVDDLELQMARDSLLLAGRSELPSCERISYVCF